MLKGNLSSKWTVPTSIHIPYKPKPSGRLILRQGVEIISCVFVSFTVICLQPAACMSRENHCPVFPINLFFCNKCKQWRKHALTLTFGAPLGCPLCQIWCFLVVCWANISPIVFCPLSYCFLQDSNMRKQKLQTRMPSLREAACV